MFCLMVGRYVSLLRDYERSKFCSYIAGECGSKVSSSSLSCVLLAAKDEMKSVWVHLLVAAAMSVPLAAADAVAAGASKCSSIEVRKEWRSLSRKEKKAWIDAVNVSFLSTDVGVCADFPLYDW